MLNIRTASVSKIVFEIVAFDEQNQLFIQKFKHSRMILKALLYNKQITKQCFCLIIISISTINKCKDEKETHLKLRMSAE